MKSKVKSLLKELEKTREKYWNIDPEVGLLLNQIIQHQNYKSVLEIGTSNGYSGIWLAEGLSKTGGHLYTIESNLKGKSGMPGRFYLAKENFKKAGLSTYITQISGHAPGAIPKKPLKFDLAFFDATKFEYPTYLSALAARIKKGGLIIADNINSHKKELAPYTKKIAALKNFKTTHLNIGTGLLISQNQ